jgi:hypothetical protein
MILPPIPRRLCCQQGISKFYPASPKSAFIKNEQKAKTKTFSFRSKGAAVWPLKLTADSPPFFTAFFVASLPPFGRLYTSTAPDGQF